MLKRGQIYKLIYPTEDSKDDFIVRNNMIISPANDVYIKDILTNSIKVIRCLFFINLGGYVCENLLVGCHNLLRIERPTTQEDFNDIAEAMEISGLTYNKQWNRIEGHSGWIGVVCGKLKRYN